LAAASPDAHEPDLASALNNLGANLTAVGRRDDALTATEQAVELYRRWHALLPHAFANNLARAESNLRRFRADLGQDPDIV
jgi:tetratricopeptide (TPR) repeat protein